MAVIPLRSDSGKSTGSVAAFAANGPVIVATTNTKLLEGLAGAIDNVLPFSNGRDVIDAIQHDGGFSALFVDFVPMMDQMTGMGVLRALRELGVAGLPIWLMADSWPEAQDIWAKEKLGAKGYCHRNAGEVLKCLGKGELVHKANPDPKADQLIKASKEDLAYLSQAFRRFAGPAADIHLREILGDSENRPQADSVGAAIDLLASRLTIQSRQQAFRESVAEIAKKKEQPDSDGFQLEQISEDWLEQVRAVLKLYVGGIGALHMMDSTRKSQRQKGIKGRGLFVAELMVHISNPQRREQFMRDLVKNGLWSTPGTGQDEQ